MTARVVDASVALKWVLPEEGSEAAAALLDGRALHAPDLLQIEAANALWVVNRRETFRTTPRETRWRRSPPRPLPPGRPTGPCCPVPSIWPGS